MEEFDQYLQQNPDKQREMIVYQGKAQEMARGGLLI
jgi:Uma2 family endonuclease